MTQQWYDLCNCMIVYVIFIKIKRGFGVWMEEPLNVHFLALRKYFYCPISWLHPRWYHIKISWSHFTEKESYFNCFTSLLICLIPIFNCVKLQELPTFMTSRNSGYTPTDVGRLWKGCQSLPKSAKVCQSLTRSNEVYLDCWFRENIHNLLGLGINIGLNFNLGNWSDVMIYW